MDEVRITIEAEERFILTKSLAHRCFGLEDKILRDVRIKTNEINYLGAESSLIHLSRLCWSQELVACDDE